MGLSQQQRWSHLVVLDYLGSVSMKDDIIHPQTRIRLRRFVPKTLCFRGVQHADSNGFDSCYAYSDLRQRYQITLYIYAIPEYRRPDWRSLTKPANPEKALRDHYDFLSQDIERLFPETWCPTGEVTTVTNQEVLSPFGPGYQRSWAFDIQEPEGRIPTVSTLWIFLVLGGWWLKIRATTPTEFEEELNYDINQLVEAIHIPQVWDDKD